MVESESSSKCIGFMCAILSGVSFTLFNTFFKLVKSLSVPEVILIRGIIQTLVIIPFLASLLLDVRGLEGTRLALWSGAAILSLALSLAFTSVSILTFGDAMAIQFSSPIIVMILSHCFLKELCGIYKTFMVALLLIGIILITKPPGLMQLFHLPNMSTDKDAINPSLPIYGYIAAFLATFAFSCNILVRKIISDKAHLSLVIFSNAIVSILGSLIAIPLVSSYAIPNDWMDIFYCILVGVFDTTGTMLMMLSLRRLPAGMVSMMRSLEVVLAYLMGIIVFNDSPDAASIIGASAVMISIVLITLEEQIMELLTNRGAPESIPLVNGQNDE